MSLPPGISDTKMFYCDKQLVNLNPLFRVWIRVHVSCLRQQLNLHLFLQTVSSNSYFLLMLNN